MALLLTFGFSALACGVYCYWARQNSIVDKPNARSSHERVTPLGGGLALFSAFFGGIGLAAALGTDWPPHLLLLATACLPLVLVGWYDDLRSLSIRVRLAVYLPVVVLLTLLILPESVGNGGLVRLLAIVAISFGLLWLLNLYNFMDGIDGIAASQSIFACVSAALLCEPGSSAYAQFCLLLAAATAGFLVWNWPPARLFMGDAGSVPAGFALGGLCLVGWVHGQLNPAVWLILLALFILDASWTLLWRIASGQPFTQAHRQHAYQRLSRRWSSHGAVNALLLVIGLFWLLPLAWMAQSWPSFSIILVIMAYLPWVIAMAKIRAIK